MHYARRGVITGEMEYVRGARVFAGAGPREVARGA